TCLGARTMRGGTMEESGVSKIITMRLDQEPVKDEFDETEPFVEEDVAPETDAYIPPRPAKRIHNPDGTVTDPELELRKLAAKKAKADAKAKVEADKKAAELEKAAHEADRKAMEAAQTEQDASAEAGTTERTGNEA
ncbi:MAG: hypothetical protein K2I74_01070, partial [Treponemataceae bacterium]|nr:hypothetical protein [Treponemataceae bacterium]